MSAAGDDTIDVAEIIELGAKIRMLWVKRRAAVQNELAEIDRYLMLVDRANARVRQWAADAGVARVDGGWLQLAEADQILTEIAQQQRQDAEILRKFHADAGLPVMNSDAALRAAIAAGFDDPTYVPPETSANTDPTPALCVFDIPEPRARSTDADIAEIDAAVEREVAVGLDAAETRVCEM